ncbi:carboxypeptidase Y [Nannizzia gypsea CBS 118893]|uniref:Carboxypeptidase Y homolog A n=1 Tax=Arthroderma gypseum (strain ATCC MYA-4604 / CBS 118893) TaxID=535722 RepID=CBPYA_ARTGP|nr:carboxypeptidase Y [Nannizzia gypsea CBS 118893]E4USS9.1 RecName: Full=Carboxypeptidase Y homolog A; Flags: Precursor [Nannizzia gypsea CBS 118893]EFR00594.1 carboxypeptidase Y [Nannizzia gypsea CBS 118893]
MKLLTTGLLASAALVAAQEQQVLRADEVFGKAPLPDASIFDETIKQFQSSIEDGISHFWSEMKTNFKDYLPMISLPKKHNRRPDSEWDHVVRGADVESVWVQGADGEKRREIDGKLKNYDLRVKSVDPSQLGIDPGVKQYSGYLDDNDADKHLFYWFFESRNDPKNDPVVLWLNGGPGCSSLTGLFLELGPATIDKNLKVVHNPYSWNSNASVIFLDQPVNVGFSYSGSSVSDTVAAGKDVYALLTLFFKQFPEYATQDFHISGESYAGHYIPVFAAEILSHKNTNINLKSALIGNGLTDPLTQYPHYRPMACGDGGYPAVLDQGTCRSMDNSLERCLSLIETCYSSESAWVCVPAAMYCNSAILAPYQQTGMNPYDVRSKCEDMGSLCYPQLNAITEWLNQKSVMKALGVEVESYESCNSGINRDFLFHGDWMKPFHRLVPSVLEKIPVLIYAGDADFICNWLGNQAWTEALEWPGHKKFTEAKLQDLKIVDNKNKGKKIGQVKSSGNFTFMRIFGAGHMVPLNQPEASLEFFNRWLRGEWH